MLRGNQSLQITNYFLNSCCGVVKLFPRFRTYVHYQTSFPKSYFAISFSSRTKRRHISGGNLEKSRSHGVIEPLRSRRAKTVQSAPNRIHARLLYSTRCLHDAKRHFFSLFFDNAPVFREGGLKRHKTHKETQSTYKPARKKGCRVIKCSHMPQCSRCPL